MARRLIPRVCAAVFVVGIAGLIVSSVAGNNNGVVLSIGGVIVVAALALLVHAAVLPGRIDVFDEAAGEAVEARVARLVAAGADEADVRGLVRDATRLGRS
jgi:hypothetical protein